ncbi:hypothetical protein AYO40_04695 [Planctomycetaceae bacterium SCGC AG-212-D15]|nr:hypothetical protein AYO40_04695 [Planctomycetaceae bacterium SCGC AG-212-D15]
MHKLSKHDIQQEALARATTGQSFANWPAIIAGFTAKGIPESEILPRENVLTYNAWRALGRQVRRGEHGVRVMTMIPVRDKRDGNADEPAPEEPGKDGSTPKRRGLRCWSATVFHISQTNPIAS